MSTYEVTIVVALPHVAEGSVVAARDAPLASSARAKRLKSTTKDSPDVAHALGHTYDVELTYRGDWLKYSPEFDCALLALAPAQDDRIGTVVLWLKPGPEKPFDAGRCAFRTSRTFLDNIDMMRMRNFDASGRIVTGFALVLRNMMTAFAVEHCDAAHPGRPDAENVAFVRSVKLVVNGLRQPFILQTSMPRSSHDFRTERPRDTFHAPLSLRERDRALQAAYDGAETAKENPDARRALNDVARSGRPWSRLNPDHLPFMRDALVTPGFDLNDGNVVKNPKRFGQHVTIFHTAILTSDDPSIVRRLMDAGASLAPICRLALRDRVRVSANAFHLAVQRYEPPSRGFDIVKHMVEVRGADPRDPDEDEGWNAGHHAMRYQQYSRDELGWFMAQGVALDVGGVGRDVCRDSPLDVAVEFNELHGRELASFWTTLAGPLRLNFTRPRPGEWVSMPVHRMLSSTMRWPLDDLLAVLRILKNAGTNLDVPGDHGHQSAATLALVSRPGDAEKIYAVVGDAWDYLRIDDIGETLLFHTGQFANARNDVAFLLKRGVDPKWLNDEGYDVLCEVGDTRRAALNAAGFTSVYRNRMVRGMAMIAAYRMLPLMSASAVPIPGNEARNLLNGPGPGHDGDDAVKRSILRILLEMGAADA